MRFPIGEVHLCVPDESLPAWARAHYAAQPGAPGVELHAALDLGGDAYTLRVEGAPRSFPDVGRAVATYHLPLADRPGLRWRRRAPDRVRGFHTGRLHADLGPADARISRAHYAPEAAIDLLTATAMACQPRLLFLHGAVLSRAGQAIVVSGVSGAGKTTTALNLAARGWTLHGDEAFAFDPDGGTVHPVPRAVLARTTGLPAFEAQPADAPRCISLVPAAAGPFPVSHVFLLRRLGGAPSFTPANPTAELEPLLDSAPVAASWGTDRARQLLRFARLAAGLRRLTLLDVTLGAPEATAEAIDTFTSGFVAPRP